MSSLAEAFVVARRDLPDLLAAAKPRRRLFGKSEDRFEETFDERARELETFDRSGHYVGVVLAYLDERDVPLLDGELSDDGAKLSEARQTTFLLFGPDAKRHLDALDAARHDVGEMRAYCEEFWEAEEPDAGEAMRDVLAFLRRGIAGLEDDSVLVLWVG